ncbi:MAG: hypothetical protein IAE95_07460 [Chitinophagaceae bacterium]|nr:hypothetical protein [Chitinophagaceae bacterium]
MINLENYEEYMVMHADGELSPSEEQELMNFLYEHPELQSELTAFSMTKMIPDTDIVFEKKDALMQPEEGKKVITFPVWRKYAVAAGVAAIFFVSYLKIHTGSTEEVTTVAAVTNPPAATTPASPVTNTTVNPTPEQNANNTDNTVPATTNTTETQAPQQKTMLAANTTKPDRVKHIDQVTGVKNMTHETAVAANTTIATEQINPVVPAEMIAWKNQENISEVFVTNVPPASIYMHEGDERGTNSIIDKLPIDELKKKGMENVASAVATGYNKVHALREEISGSAISLKIEKRKLVISF